MRPFRDHRWLSLSPLALALAVALVLWLGPQRDGAVLANLDVGDSSIPSLYLQVDAHVPRRCTVTDRQGSTLRRDDDPRRQQDWECARGADPSADGLDHWLVRSRRGGAFLLVPAFAVADWTYPLLHAYARARGAGDLPPVSWERLFVDRIYRGVYLRVALPGEPPGRAPGVDRRELLVVRGDRLQCADDLLRSPCEVYPGLIAAGRFPAPGPAPGLLPWLLSAAPGEETVLLLDAEEPHGLTWLPLPVSLVAEIARISGAEPGEVLDERARQLGWPRQAQALRRLPAADRGELQAAWSEYRRRLTAATALHCAYHGCSDALPATWRARLTEPWLQAGGAG